MSLATTREPRMQTPDTRLLLSHFIRQIEARHVRSKFQEPAALHYDSHTGGLVDYYWPCKLNPDKKKSKAVYIRVAPGELEDHRRTHEFRGPCCLCALLDGEEYTEAQIAVVEVLTEDESRNHCLLNGEIVAQCARQRCGYLLCLERFYELNSLRLRKYRPRENPLAPQDLIHISDIEKSFRRGDGLFQVMPDIVLRGHRRGLDTVDPAKIKAVNANLWEDLMLGLTEERFWDTFVQCLECKQVTFREHYASNHRCLSPDAKREALKRRDSRFQPYSRRERPVGTRVLSRMDTLLCDEPERPAMRSLFTPQRDFEEDNYDPEDVVFSESLGGSSPAFANDEEVSGEDDELDVGNYASSEPGSSSWPWWLPDIPPLGSDDSLPDIVTVLANSRLPRAALSGSRTDVEGSEGLPESESSE